jgi:hypothetical protein
MSLKAFHVIFITSAFLLAVFLGGWCLNEYSRNGQVIQGLLGLLSLAGSVALIVYGRYFMKKLKNIDYF